MIRKYLLCVTMLLMLGGIANSQRLAGVWRLDEVKTTGTSGQTTKFTQPNMYLFTKGHYSIIRVEGDKPRSTDDATKMTSDQLVDVYVRSFVANAGTYEMKGDTLTMKVMIAKSPTFMQPGHWISYSVKLTGDKLTLTSIATEEGPTKEPSTFTLTRVE